MSDMPKLQTVTVHIHSVDESAKVLWASFSSNRSGETAASRPPVPVNISDIPKNAELAKLFLERIAIGFCEREDAKQFVSPSDVSFWKAKVGSSWNSTLSPTQILAKFDYTSGDNEEAISQIVYKILNEANLI